MDHDWFESRREAVCTGCGHGSDVHDGAAANGRQAGWCRCCHDRITEGSPLPMCYWFQETSAGLPPPRERG